ncbi:MAG: NADH:ubiquinone reductase (Na(+)-transporting) subunit C [Candidatus Marinimicrobia bacterium]|nr:NADH:ubiquinone reductase (Na(+)-transporting) subunit C [Candidatus Neomarinimicrobiota bacterium]|tara:strand:- start:38367 stop:39071 length:705 start_codon:yes stop_codon:yes gene_type:complete
MRNKYIFILTITIISSFFLSLASEGFKELKRKNIEIDKKKNILSAIGVAIDNFTVDDIDEYFQSNIDSLIINIDGLVVNNISIEDLNEVENKSTGEVRYFYENNEFLPLYVETKENVIIMPISGKGLWSSLFGYFALDADNYSTVKGITFYAHAETPGLGAEISKKWFQDNFVNKEIYEKNNLKSISVAKGKADENSKYEVDGISGATITSNGVTTLLSRDLRRYEPYFYKNRR